MRRAGPIAGLAAALAATAALAQPPPVDPIDALLRPLPPAETLPPAPQPYEPPPPSQPPPPQPLMPPPRGSEPGPLPLEQRGPPPDGPPTAADVAYDDRLRASMAAQQGLRGPMDGGWSLAAGGRELYVLQISDRRGVLEGAWRDPARPGVSGFIDGAERSGADIILRFAAATVTLHGDPAGWSGELRDGQRLEPVVMRRRGP